MFTAIVNCPGYLPDTDEPCPTFRTTSEAWRYLAAESTRDEVNDETQRQLAALGRVPHSLGTVCSDVPWLAYSVMPV